MKKLMILALTFIAITATAQGRGEGKKMTAEEMATLQTKKMTLALVLDESQARQVHELNLEQSKTRLANRATRKNKREEAKTSGNRRFNDKEKMLDQRIARQNKMQQILNEEQFKQWLKMEKKRRGRKGKRDGKNKKRRVDQSRQQ